jgi:2-polyprenyl-6-hydroxyphenyl methylase/3-demethylubiquinone-9 3-methyltransferase
MENEKRFEFGKNWKNFLKNLTPNKIAIAKSSLENLIGKESLKDKTFLDIGSGSGLFSLSAYNLGAKVKSFDYDEFSVEATNYTKSKFASDDLNWSVERGDVLDDKYIESLGKYDIVYSWGVLHHTGSMYEALTNAAKCVNEKGTLVVAIYNTQMQTPVWLKIKKFYVKSPKIIKILMNYIFTAYTFIGLFIVDLIRLRNPIKRHTDLRRGMSFYTDVVDWIGGYPFETAKPEEIVLFYNEKGFVLENMKTVGGSQGCNEFVFKKL